MTGVWVLTHDCRLIDLASGCYIIPFQESVKALVSSGPDWETLCLCENMEQAKGIVVRIAREIGAVDVADLNNLEKGASGCHDE